MSDSDIRATTSTGTQTIAHCPRCGRAVLADVTVNRVEVEDRAHVVAAGSAELVIEFLPAVTRHNCETP